MSIPIDIAAASMGPSAKIAIRQFEEEIIIIHNSIRQCSFGQFISRI